AYRRTASLTSARGPGTRPPGHSRRPLPMAPPPVTAPPTPTPVTPLTPWDRAPSPLEPVNPRKELPMKWTARAAAQTGSEIPAAENHNAVCVGLVDLGRHAEEYENRNGTIKKLVLFIAIAWELAQTRSASTERHVVIERYSYTFSEKSKLRQLLEGWRGTKFEPDAEVGVAGVLGRPCLLQIVHKKSARGNLVANIDQVSKLPAGMTPLVPQHQPFTWEITDESGALIRRDVAFPDNLSWVPWLYGQRLADVITSSYDW